MCYDVAIFILCPKHNVLRMPINIYSSKIFLAQNEEFLDGYILFLQIEKQNYVRKQNVVTCSLSKNK